MKTLHLASFKGNIGDQLNHLGFRQWFEQTTGGKFAWQDLEIREFYRGNIKFNQDFIDQCNSSDLLIIGGGNYFELWPENSETGTSIDMPIPLLEKIKIPIFFNALGVDTGQGIGSAARQYFLPFLEYITSNPRYLVTIRNDGSKNNLSDIAPQVNNVYELPDHGFFGHNPKVHKTKETNLVALNLAGDMGSVRFKNFKSEDEFYSKFAQTLVHAWQDRNFSYKFIPHVHGDYYVLNKLCNFLPDKLIRENLLVSQLDTISAERDKLFAEYNECDFALVNRFHANVYCISNRIPFLGLSNYPQISKTLINLDLGQHIVNIEARDFQQIFIEKIDWLFRYRDFIIDSLLDVNTKLLDKRTKFEPILQRWMSYNFGK